MVMKFEVFVENDIYVVDYSVDFLLGKIALNCCHLNFTTFFTLNEVHNQQRNLSPRLVLTMLAISRKQLNKSEKSS